MTAPARIRCAIYTRKSSEEGLEQEFNSLDAQYEACKAYVASQRQEGWSLVPERFDDGGLSGGTLDRPALHRLLAEIEAGRIGMVVVYKIDRLTRSLADFVRLVERLQARACSFVSVTQAFNTSSSMGRLTLNVLLSFAQFEREVTAERIRDKIAASKQKGLWMGGRVPLGYARHPDPQRRELMVEPAEATTVQKLFELYGALGSLCDLEIEAARRGLRPRAPVHPETGTFRPRPFSRGQLHYLLTNPVYLGRIRHKDRTYPGQHPALVPEDLWQRVQDRMMAARARPRGRSQAGAEPRLLLGKIRDETGDLLTPTHTQRHGRRFSYYVSRRLVTGGADPTGWRIPARALEAALAGMVLGHLREMAQSHRLLDEPDILVADRMVAEVATLAQACAAEPARLGRLVARVTLGPGSVRIRLEAAAIGEAFGLAPERIAAPVLDLAGPFRIRRRGNEARIVAGERLPSPDPVLLRILSEARTWARDLRAGIPLATIAARTGHSEAYLRTRLPIAFLSPRLQQAILEGRQSPDLTVARLVRERIPLDWAAQERRFGAA
ncbi:recombinase family protein [Tabrizicola sp. J26]|uniref:recombinase family protein n=1 Tax=Alitabrizicola rongguiensis TaxID=2909234 RepID=UPI001F47BA89|nr:recombinase family protein [Tabrizicola rongguiensis]MCF1710356.1 recombinase family protein [Tabrizicola rongguiensis]